MGRKIFAQAGCEQRAESSRTVSEYLQRRYGMVKYKLAEFQTSAVIHKVGREPGRVCGRCKQSFKR